jgi:hypothetical protein
LFDILASFDVTSNVNISQALPPGLIRHGRALCRKSRRGVFGARGAVEAGRFYRLRSRGVVAQVEIESEAGKRFIIL